MPVTTPQSVSVFAALHKDIDARNRKGWETYGKSLETFNGRDSLLDVYEESLDMTVYLKQRLLEDVVRNKAMQDLEMAAEEALAVAVRAQGMCDIGCGCVVHKLDRALEAWRAVKP